MNKLSLPKFNISVWRKYDKLQYSLGRRFGGKRYYQSCGYNLDVTLCRLRSRSRFFSNCRRHRIVR